MSTILFLSILPSPFKLPLASGTLATRLATLGNFVWWMLSGSWYSSGWFSSVADWFSRVLTLYYLSPSTLNNLKSLE